MTKLYVQEFNGLAASDKSAGAVTPGVPLTSYILDYSSGHVESPQFNPATKFIMVNPDSISAILFGTFGSVTATTSNAPRYAANDRVIYGVGGATGLSVVTTT